MGAVKIKINDSTDYEGSAIKGKTYRLTEVFATNADDYKARIQIMSNFYLGFGFLKGTMVPKALTLIDTDVDYRELNKLFMEARKSKKGGTIDITSGTPKLTLKS